MAIFEAPRLVWLTFSLNVLGITACGSCPLGDGKWWDTLESCQKKPAANAKTIKDPHGSLVPAVYDSEPPARRHLPTDSRTEPC